MSLLDGVVALLWADAGFQAASPGGIMPVLLVEGATLPATTYQMVGGSSVPTFDTVGMQTTRVQFDFRAADQDSASGYTLAGTARAALRAVLEGFHGALSNGYVVQNAQWIHDSDAFDQDSRQYRCMSEFYLYSTQP